MRFIFVISMACIAHLVLLNSSQVRAEESMALRCCRSLSADSDESFAHSPTDSRGYLVYQLYVPANTIASVTQIRKSGTGDFDIEVASDVSSGTWKRASVSGLIASNAETDSSANVVLIPPEPTGRTVYVHFHVYSNQSWDGTIHTRSIHIGEALGRTIFQTAGQYMLESAIQSLLGIEPGPSSTANENVGRAVSLGISMLNRSNIASVGVDAAVNEMQVQLSRQFPGERFLIIGVTNFFSNILQQLYEPALANLSN